MAQLIDFESKLSFEDYILLYCYDMAMAEKEIPYADWCLKEDLIHRYNREQDQQKLNKVTKTIIQHSGQIETLKEKWETEPWEVEKPVIWGDRVKSEYYIKNLTDSHKLEVYADYIFKTKYDVDIGLYYGKSQQYNKGETKAGIEIKCDKLFLKTGNYYFEYQERIHANSLWVNSGILKEDNTKYYLYRVVGNIKIFSREALKQIYEELVVHNHPVAGCRKVAARIGTSKGFVVNKDYVEALEVPMDQVVQELRSAFKIN